MEAIRQRLKQENLKEWTLFLDRDGVINQRIPDHYIREKEKFKLIPGVREALNELRSLFGKIFLVTNQRGIAIGKMSEVDLAEIHRYMDQLIGNPSTIFDSIYFCPHDRDVQCGCRKPATGMALEARAEYPEIDFIKSVMVGDRAGDIEFGKQLGMITVKVGPEENDECRPDLRFNDLPDFTRWLNASET